MRQTQCLALVHGVSACQRLHACNDKNHTQALEGFNVITLLMLLLASQAPRMRRALVIPVQYHAVYGRNIAICELKALAIGESAGHIRCDWAGVAILQIARRVNLHSREISTFNKAVMCDPVLMHTL